MRQGQDISRVLVHVVSAALIEVATLHKERSMSFLNNLFGGHHDGRHGGHHQHDHHDEHYDRGYGYRAPTNAYGNPVSAPPTGVVCPSCRATNGVGARFCQQCGTSLVPKVCKQCGSTVQAGAKFCAQCGQTIA